MSTKRTRVFRSLKSGGEEGGEGGSQASSHRVFSESDETKLLEAYLKVVSEQPSPTAVTSPSMEAIEESLRLRFSHTQIIDKLRRLRLKYHRQARTKSLIKTPHDHRLFSISREIWGKRRPHPPPHRDFGPLVEELGRALPRNGLWESGLECLDRESVKAMNSDWVLLRIQEAELVTRKAELVNECTQLVRQALSTHS